MPHRKLTKNETKLTTRQFVVAMWRVATTTYKAAPMAIVVQIAGSLITAILPIVTTYFAALTTTALAEAYAGDESAGQRALTYVFVTAGLGVVLTAWGSLSNYVSQIMRYRVEAAMTDRMYEHFLGLDFWRYDDKRTADQYDKAQQFARFFPYVFERLTNIVTFGITTVAGVGALVIVSWWLGAIALAAIVPGLIIQLRLSKASTKHWKENIETRRTQGMIEWQILQPRLMAELRLYGIVRYLLDLRMKMRDKDERARIEFERGYIGKKLGADLIEASAEVTALVWTTLQIIAQAQPIGQFIYVQQIVSRAFGGANSLVNTISSIDEDIANLYEYQAFMELPVARPNAITLTQAPKTISVEDLTFNYPGSERSVLKNVSFSVDAGQHVAIVGENGAGKSTLVKLLTGLYEPTRGSIKLGDADITKVDLASWHKYLSVLQQDFIQYGFATARDNVWFGDTSSSIDVARFERAMKQAEAKEFVDKLPNGPDSYVHQWMEDADGNAGADLSGGQWQRLALARNFYRDASIIILDEPTSAIDALAESRIFEHLFASEKTVLTISHRLTTVEKADVILMFKEGILVERGTFDELVKAEGEFVRMFESQLRPNKRSRSQ